MYIPCQIFIHPKLFVKMTTNKRLTVAHFRISLSYVLICCNYLRQSNIQAISLRHIFSRIVKHTRCTEVDDNKQKRKSITGAHQFIVTPCREEQDISRLNNIHRSTSIELRISADEASDALRIVNPHYTHGLY